jgi:hypothetical protein
LPSIPNESTLAKKKVAECCRFLILVSNKPWHPHIP